MSGMLFKVRPEVLRDAARAELNHAAVTLRLISDALLRPELTLTEARKVQAEELCEARTLVACAINKWERAMKERAALQPEMELWRHRVEGKEVAA